MARLEQAAPSADFLELRQLLTAADDEFRRVAALIGKPSSAGPARPQARPEPGR
jgi:hypothetical protein